VIGTWAVNLSSAALWWKPLPEGPDAQPTNPRRAYDGGGNEMPLKV
jgi:hypothetical protein